MVFKLNIKEGNYAEWLKSELRQRFSYSCVESIQAFRAAERALTREGQVKHSKTRHEKNDKYAVGDRRNWILGFDNREKLALFQQQAQELAAAISDLDKKINALSEQDNLNAKRALHCQTLVNMQWQEIDALPIIERISVIEKQIREMRDGNKVLQEISERINMQKSIVSRAENDLSDARGEYKKTLDKLTDSKDYLNKLQNDPSIVAPTPFQKKGLDDYFARITDNVRLDNLGDITTSVVQLLGEEIRKVSHDIDVCVKEIEKILQNSAI